MPPVGLTHGRHHILAVSEIATRIVGDILCAADITHLTLEFEVVFSRPLSLRGEDDGQGKHAPWDQIVDFNACRKWSTRNLLKLVPVFG
jgi:hypothetical protein